MAIFCINYDLSAPGRDYAKIAAGIEKVSSDNIHPLKSCWLVSTSLNRAEVRKVLYEHVDANDLLLVVEARVEEWIGQGLDTSSVNWLLRHSALGASSSFPPGFAPILANPPFPPPEWLPVPPPFPPPEWRLGEIASMLSPVPSPFPRPEGRLGEIASILPPVPPFESRRLGELPVPPLPRELPDFGELILGRKF